jgi:hypothetical protein
MASTPRLRSRSRNDGASSAAAAVSWSFCTIDDGVPFGKKSPYQLAVSRLARPCSSAVGTSGSIGEREGERVAIALTVPAWICGRAVRMKSQM